MKTFYILIAVLLCNIGLCAQPLITRNGYIGFFSKTPFEDIKAENSQVVAAIDLQKKTMAFTALLKSFLFRKELMQQHFNENYVESDKYPKTSFYGSFSGDVNPQKEGQYPVQVKGKLTLHGVTREVAIPAVIVVQKGKLSGTANFQLEPGDFNIKIPAVVRDKIAERIDVNVKTEYSIN
ncbi:MAG TPA: YceI family protein [Flavisolibacter sp.]|nr:YceI family protein [Flavisolibacter sp.]